MPSNVSKSLHVEYTSKPLSGWGGLLPFFEFFNATVAPVFESLLPDKSSNNQIAPVDLVRTLVATSLVGGSRFAHVERVRYDEVIREITSARRLGSADSLRRYLSGFTASQNEDLHAGLRRASWALLGDDQVQDVLDLDSTILNRFGEQEGVAKGYHPTRRVARSHHPLLAMLANSKTIVHLWLRAGGSSTHRGALEFLDELVASMPANIRLTAIRADSGFFSTEYLNGFETRGLSYAISMKMSQPVKRFAAQIAEDLWERFDDDNQAASVSYKAPQWKTSRRVVFVRNRIKAKDGNASLFELPMYEYRAIVTSLDGSAVEIISFYNKRGDCENRIKEFKNDLGARGFCLDSFIGTEVVLRILAATFNLLTAFKVHVLRDATLTLGTIRNSIFVIGASLGREARKRVLRLGLVGRWRTGFQELRSALSAHLASTAAQFAKPLSSLAELPRSVWRSHRPRPAIL